MRRGSIQQRTCCASPSRALDENREGLIDVIGVPIMNLELIVQEEDLVNHGK